MGIKVILQIMGLFLKYFFFELQILDLMIWIGVFVRLNLGYMMMYQLLGVGDSEYWVILVFMRVWVLGSQIMINDYYKYLCGIFCFIIFFRNLVNFFNYY